MTSLEILALVAPILAVMVVFATVLFEMWLDERAERQKQTESAAE